MKTKYKPLIAERNRIAYLKESGYEVDPDGQLTHRRVCREAHGPYPKDWVVYHLDCNKLNNAPNNLIAIPRTLHDSIHVSVKRGKSKWTRDMVEQALRAWKGLRKPNAKVELKVIQEVKQCGCACTCADLPVLDTQEFERIKARIANRYIRRERD